MKSPAVDLAERLKQELPHDRDAEMATVGSLILEPSFVEDIVDGLMEKDFFHDDCRKVYESLVLLSAACQKIDTITLVSNLRDRGVYEQVGGAAFIGMLAQSVPSAASLLSYAAIVAEKARLRSIIEIGREMILSATEQSDEAKDSIAIAGVGENKIKQIGASDQAAVVNVGTAARAYVADVRSLVESGKGGGIETGIACLDKTTGGCHPSEFIVIAARPSIGKTSLGLQVIENAAINGMKSMFISIEMTAPEIAGRLVANNAQVEGQMARMGMVGTDSLAKLDNAAAEMSELPLSLWRPRSCTIEQIRAQAKLQQQTVGLDILGIDYLTKIQDSYPDKARHENITHIVQQSAALAEELSIPVVMLAQAKRTENNKRPTYSDLFGSSMIEAEAASVWMLHREDTSAEEAWIYIDKNRHGTTGPLEVRYEKRYTRFVDHIDALNDASPYDFGEYSGSSPDF